MADKPNSNELFTLLRERRGWTQEYLAAINNPDYQRLLDMDTIVKRLHEIRTSGQLLVVLPDFDMDGITSGTLGFAGLCELGFNVALYIPDHGRGHGFSSWDVEQILTRHPDAGAIITCDNGVDSYEAIDHAVRAGLVTLITDHHLEIAREGLDRSRYLPAHAVVDPNRADETYPNKYICGAHVLYQVLVSYAREHAAQNFDDISLLRLFAGIGTVSDVMPITYENRRLVSDSVSVAKLLYVEPEKDDSGQVTMPDVEASTLMKLLRSRPHHPTFLSAFEGMARIIAHFAMIGKLRNADDIDEGFYGFYLAPAFNAIRRMDGSMTDGFGSFFAHDKASKDAHISSVIEMNDRRKEMIITEMEAVMDRPQPYAPYIYLSDAIKGMLGLVANKLMDLNGVPTAVINDHGKKPHEELSGSCRAPAWYDMASAINGAGFWAAGHEQAHGVRVKNRQELERLREFLKQDVQRVHDEITSQPGYSEPAADLSIGHLPSCDSTGEEVEEMVDLARLIETLQPFGHGFEAPSIEFVADLANCSVDIIGAQKNHLRITMPSGVRCLAWNQADRLLDLTEAAQEPLEADRTIRLRGQLELNHYMGSTSTNLKITSIHIPADQNSNAA